MNAVPVTKTYDWHRAVVGNVSTEALALVLVLTNRMNADGTLPRQFTPSLETMSREMGYAANSRRAIVRAMKELEDGGYLLVERGGGRKATNKYRASVPSAVAEEPPKDAETVAETPNNGGVSATHPTPIYSTPNPPVGQKDAERRTQLANEVVQAVAAKLPSGEADALVRDLAALRNRDQLRDVLATLVEKGWRDAVIHELTAVKVRGHATPYAGCEHPGRVAWGRVRDLCRTLDATAT